MDELKKVEKRKINYKRKLSKMSIEKKLFSPMWDFAFKNIFGDDEKVFLDFINSVFEDNFMEKKF